MGRRRPVDDSTIKRRFLNMNPNCRTIFNMTGVVIQMALNICLVCNFLLWWIRSFLKQYRIYVRRAAVLNSN